MKMGLPFWTNNYSCSWKRGGLSFWTNK